MLIFPCISMYYVHSTVNTQKKNEGKCAKKNKKKSRHPGEKIVQMW